MSRSWILLSIILIILTGLAANFLFAYESSITNPEISKIKNSSSWNTQQLAKIDKNQTNFSFVVYGDSQDSIYQLEKMLRSINQKNALFAIANGDITLYGRESEFYYYLNQLKISKIPTLTTIGNHDIDYKTDKFYYNQLFGPSYYSFAMKNSYFIFLDDSDSSSMNTTQIKWLTEQLKKGQKYKYRFLFLHVPLYNPYKGNYIPNSLKKNNSSTLNNLFDKYNVTMIFSSHLHGYFNGTWNKTPYIISGGGGAAFSGTDPQHFFYHYILVKVTNNNVTYTVVKY